MTLAQSIEDYLLYRRTAPVAPTVNLVPRAGDRVHLVSRGGAYLVVDVSGLAVTLTCKKWAVQVERGQRGSATAVVHASDVKCPVGAPYSSWRHRRRRELEEELERL